MRNVYWSQPCVCLSVPRHIPMLLHGPDVSVGNGRRRRVVVRCWADLQSVHGFHCCDNIAPNAKCQRVLLCLSFAFLLRYWCKVLWSACLCVVSVCLSSVCVSTSLNSTRAKSAVHGYLVVFLWFSLLWSPYGIGQTIIFSSYHLLARLQTWRAIIFSQVCLSVCLSLTGTSTLQH